MSSKELLASRDTWNSCRRLAASYMCKAAAHPDDECGYFNVLHWGSSCLPPLLKNAAVVVQGGSECPRLRECVLVGLYHVRRECRLVTYAL